MPREDLLTTDKEKIRAKAEIHRFLTRLAVFAALCWVLFGVVFGLAVVPGSTMAPRLCSGDLVLFSRFERGTAAGQVVLYRQDGTQLYVSRGLGPSHRLPLRICNPPELPVITLTRG